MISIQDKVVKRQPNFWNNCLFHPTDAIEDSWGKRILDRIAADRSIQTVRIYAMLEDIVYTDEEGNLQYDFRVSDLRIDYLLACGFDPLIAYAGIPDCIAANTLCKTSNSKNKTRYKGKLFNTSAPSDYALWEEVCYEYTRHLVERYGIDRVATWHLHCWNEPDVPAFLRSDLPEQEGEQQQQRLEVYCKLYEAFVRGLMRVSDRFRIGGPALACHTEFLEGFLNFVRERNLRIDYIALHNYPTTPMHLRNGSIPLSVENLLKKHAGYMDVINRCGFGDREIVVDEWGASSHGFFNKDEAPELIFRETEVFSAYFVRLIYDTIQSGDKITKLLICLSGQHEMTEDFSGFRNFFTLNFIAKPIYNAYILASKLGENLLAADGAKENTCVIPTRDEQGDYKVLLSYAASKFEENIPCYDEFVTFPEDAVGKNVTVWCIDRENTNPYRLYERLGITEPTAEQIKLLREEGKLKPIAQFVCGADCRVPLHLTPNATVLITVSK